MDKVIMEWDTSEIEEDDVDWMWDDFVENLTGVMKKKNYRNYHKDKWMAKVNNFGWRHLDGNKCVTAENGIELLREILPDCDCTFKIFHNGRTGLKIQNFHHDSPVGNEWYYIRPMTIKEVENN